MKVQHFSPVRSNTSNSLDSTQLLLLPVSRSTSSILSLATSLLTFRTRGLENSSSQMVTGPVVSELAGWRTARSASW